MATTKAKRQVTMTCTWRLCGAEYVGERLYQRGFCSDRCRKAYHRWKAKRIDAVQAEFRGFTIKPGEPDPDNPDRIMTYIAANYTQKGWEMIEVIARMNGETVQEFIQESIREAMDSLHRAKGVHD